MGKTTFICFLLCVSKHCVTNKAIMGSRAGSRSPARSPRKSPRKSPTRAKSPRKSPVRKSPARKSPARKSPAKKSPAKAKRSPSKKRRSTSRKAAAHPAYKDMIKAAIIGLKQRGGSSRQAIAKYIAGHYKVGDNANVHLRMAIKRALASGMLVTNATHSNTFRLAPEAKKVPKTPKKKKV